MANGNGGTHWTLTPQTILSLIAFIALSIGVSASVTVWVVGTHAQMPHRDAVSQALFDQYQRNNREWVEELKADISELKVLIKRNGRYHEPR
jgi:hypothetical protein